MVMKMIFPILLLINISCCAQDTLPIYSHHYLIENEINCCKGEKNQLKCVDSLIGVNLKALNLNYSGKIDTKKVYLDRLRKICIYHFTAGMICGLRGNLEQSFIYFDQMESYLDTLNVKGKGEDELNTLKSITLYQKTEFCAKMFLKDTAVFNHCNCLRFFPEIKDESVSVILDSVSSSISNQEVVVKSPTWGEFYLNDTLRMNKSFVSDSMSIGYFKKFLQPLIRTKLLQNPYYYETLGDPSINLKSDTIIYKLSANYEKGKFERNCELVFTSSLHPEWFDYTMLQISNLEFPLLVKDLEIYIPIVMSTANTMHNHIYIHDDHFRIEIRKIPPIDPK
jgi:hypothetical protein